MKLPTSGGASAINSVMLARTETYTFTRPSESSGARGGTTSTSTHTADVWLFSPREINLDTEYGDRLTGGLGGLAPPTEDIEPNDRVTYQGVPYEVDETITTDESGDVVMVINLTRRTNDS